MKKFWAKIKEVASYMVLTNLGRIGLAFIWILIFLSINSVVDGVWAFWTAMVGVAYLVGFTLVAIVFAWIINPIRDRKRRKELERQKKK